LLSLSSLRELTFFALDPRREASVGEWLPDSVKTLLERSSCSTKRLFYRNFRRPVEMSVLYEQLRSVAVDLKVDCVSFDFPSYDIPV